MSHAFLSHRSAARNVTATDSSVHDALADFLGIAAPEPSTPTPQTAAGNTAAVPTLPAAGRKLREVHPLLELPVKRSSRTLSDDTPMVQMDRLFSGAGLIKFNIVGRMQAFVEMIDGRQFVATDSPRDPLRTSDDGTNFVLDARRIRELRRIVFTSENLDSTFTVGNENFDKFVQVPVRQQGYGVAAHAYVCDGILVVRQGVSGYQTLRDLCVSHGFTTIMWASPAQPMKEQNQ